MIVNGSSNRCVWWWTQHLESEVNEKAEVVKSHGLRGETIRDMLEEMQTLAAGSACENFFYQINMNPAPGERPTPDEWDHARKIAEKAHGLEGQPYFMVMHTKHGREHPHFIYFRVNLETGKTVSDSYDAPKNHAIAREIERELGLQKVIGPYDREPWMPRPERGPKRWEMYRGMKTELDPRDVTAELTELRQQCDNGKAFQAALELRGYILAQGDRMVAGERALMIIDPAGNDHHLPRRIKGMNSTQVNEFMRSVDRAALPTLEQGKAQYQERKIAGLEADRATVRDEIQWEEALAKAAIAKEERERRFTAPEDREKHTVREQTKAPELERTAGEIRLAYTLTQTGPQFASALEDRGLILAQTTQADADRLNKWESRRLKEQERELQDYQKHRPGELVVVNQYGDVFKLTRSNTGDATRARAEHLKDIDRAPLLSVIAAQVAMRQFQQDRREEKQQAWEQKRLGAAKEKVWPVNPPQPERKHWTDFDGAAREAGNDARPENLTGPAAQVWQAWCQIDQAKYEKHFAALDEHGIPFSVATDARAFAAALDDKGISFARVTKEESDRSHTKEADFARAVGNHTPRFKEGEIVIVTEPRLEYRRNGETTEPRSRVYKLEQSLAGKFVNALGNADKLQGIDATIKVSDQRAKQRAADWQAIRLERATSIRRAPRTRTGNTKDNLLKRPAAILSAPSRALNIIAKPAELLSNAIEGLFAPILTPEQIRDGKIAAQERKAEGRDQIEVSNTIAEHAQERQQEEQREAARQRERERERGGRDR